MKFRIITLLLLSLGALSSCNFGHYPSYSYSFQLTSLRWTSDNSSLYALAQIPKDNGRLFSFKIFQYDANGAKVKEYSPFPEGSYVNAFYITPDGKRCIYQGGIDFGVHYIEIETGKELFAQPSSYLLSTSPEGGSFVSSLRHLRYGPYYTYQFYSLGSGGAVQTDSLNILPPFNGGVLLLLPNHKSASLEYDSLNFLHFIVRDSTLQITKILTNAAFNATSHTAYSTASDVFTLQTYDAIYIVNSVTGSVDSLLSQNYPNFDNYCAITHDGKRILFVKSGESKITVRDIQTRADQYVEINYSPSTCSISSDDKKLAYAKSSGGKDDEIVVVNIP